MGDYQSMKEITKQVLDARYIDWLIKYEECLGRAVDVYDIMKKNLGDFMSDDDINKIIDIEEIDNKLKACEVSTVMDYMIRTLKAICRYEGKTYGEINSHMEKIISKEYGISAQSVNIYYNIGTKLNTLQKIGKVVVEGVASGKNLYKWVEK